MKAHPWIILILILFTNSTKSSAQLWKYLNYNPGTEDSIKSALNKEACSASTGWETVYGEKTSYSIRTFCIRSFEGIPGKISIYERQNGHNLFIQGPHSLIKINDISGLVKLHFLQPELLEVVYSPRGGSDQGFEYTIVIGLKANRLHTVAEFMTIDESNMPDAYQLYEARLEMLGKSLSNCQLAVTVREKLQTDTSQAKNYDRQQTFLLKFDKTQKIFYTEIKHLNQVFEVPTAHIKSKRIKGNFPVITLGADNSYYYINNSWYQINNHKLFPVH